MDFRIENINGDITQNSLILIQKSPFPLAFSVEAGAYINSIRSSLDILATALAVRHGITNVKEVFFPIVDDVARFNSGKGFKGDKFVEALPRPEKAKIKAIRPYKGGDAQLWLLHRFDITRKHKNLLHIACDIASLTVTFRDIAPPDISTKECRFGTHNEAVIAVIPNSVTKSDIKIAPLIAFDEPESGKLLPVSLMLRSFAATAYNIISEFSIT